MNFPKYGNWTKDKSLDSCLSSGSSHTLFYHLRRTLSLIVLSDFIYCRIFLRKFESSWWPFLQTRLHNFQTFPEKFWWNIWPAKWSRILLKRESWDNRVWGRNPECPRKAISRRENTALLQKHFLPILLNNFTANIKRLCDFQKNSILRKVRIHGKWNWVAIKRI